MKPSAFICVICGFFRSVGGLGGLGVFAVQDYDVFVSLCLCVFVFATLPAGHGLSASVVVISAGFLSVR